MPKILGVSGSLRQGSNTLVLIRSALEAARSSGANVELLDLRDHPLPLYEAHESYDENPMVEKVIAAVASADGVLVGSPEYHGCMSGATKNFFDFLYREISGKVFGLISATGGSQGSGCFDNMRTAIQYCHGWVLPYNVAATGRDIDATGKINARVQDRLDRLGRDVTVYAPVLWNQFKKDQKQSGKGKPGFAQWSV